MQEKTLLITSMQKLINHISLNQANQQEIFNSLTKNDFKKILTNLDDPNPSLRKTSLLLMTHLIHRNYALKEKFCSIMSIPLIQGRIALNSRFLPADESSHWSQVQMMSQVLTISSMLKKPASQQQKQSLFWCVTCKSDPRGRKTQLIHFSKINIDAISEIVDPIDSLVGFYLPRKQSKQSLSSLQKNSQQQPIYIPPRRKSDYDLPQKPFNNFFIPSKHESIVKSDMKQPQTIPPGYATDRQPSYPQPQQMNNQQQRNKAVSSHIYQEGPPTTFNKAQQSFSSNIQNVPNNVAVNSSFTVNHGSKPVSINNSLNGSFNVNQNQMYNTGQSSGSANQYLETRNNSKSFSNYVKVQIVPKTPQIINSTQMNNFYEQKGIQPTKPPAFTSQKISRNFQTLRDRKIVQKYPF